MHPASEVCQGRRSRNPWHFQLRTGQYSFCRPAPKVQRSLITVADLLWRWPRRLWNASFWIETGCLLQAVGELLRWVCEGFTAYQLRQYAGIQGTPSHGQYSTPLWHLRARRTDTGSINTGTDYWLQHHYSTAPLQQGLMPVKRRPTADAMVLHWIDANSLTSEKDMFKPP